MAEPRRPTVFVTGASAGIGAETARQAAETGYDVAIGYRSDAGGAERVAAEVEARGGRSFTIGGDLADPATHAGIWASLDAAFPQLDALINNAGIVGRKARVEAYDVARVRRMFDVNTVAPMMLCVEAVRRMSTRHGGAGGAIVNVSSMAARIGSPDEYVDYAASKAALDTFTRGLALEVAEEGIRVNSVRPGTIETGIHAKGGQPDRTTRVAPLVPMGRVGTPAEVARSILWLISENSSYVTGACIDVSGGR